MAPRLVTLICAGLLLAIVPASANWLTKALEHAGDASKLSSRSVHGFSHDLGHALAHVKALPDRQGIQALAAEAGQEGHWRFANAKGETYTAANAGELAGMRDSLLPGTSGNLALYLTLETVATRRAFLRDLPPEADLFVATPSGAYRLVREGSGETEIALAQIKPNLRTRIDSKELFSETLFQLNQPLKPSRVRVLALETGSADSLPVVPRFDPETRMALVDRLDPARLSSSLEHVQGQTVVLTGGIKSDALSFIDPNGGDGLLPLKDIRAAARNADVNLVIVKSETRRQPGGKNWLWQTATIPGLDAAVKQPTFGDFLARIAPDAEPLTILARRDGFDRVVLEALPPSSSRRLSDSFTGWMDSLAGDAMGRIAMAGFEADLRDERRQAELDRRIVPGISSSIQIGYLLLLASGLFGLGTGWSWWDRIWPTEDRTEYGSYVGYALARLVRGLAFVLVFLPLVGLPLFLRYVGLQLWALLTAPVRFMRWLRERLALSAT
jgi:hypothetical protein